MTIGIRLLYKLVAIVCSIDLIFASLSFNNHNYLTIYHCTNKFLKKKETHNNRMDKESIHYQYSSMFN